MDADSSFHGFADSVLAKRVVGIGIDTASIVSSAAFKLVAGMVLCEIRDRVVHLDQPSIDAVRPVNPALASELQALLDLLNSVPAPTSLDGVIGLFTK